ncbi:MAG: hypothetical protein U1E65_34670 [Myxococcota bacterium]
MRAPLLPLVALALSGVACIDGPDQIYTPNTGDTNAQNGFTGNKPFTPSGTTSYTDQGGGSDSAGRAVICDRVKADQQIQEMVVAPIIPDTSVGGVPIRAPDGKPLLADTLIGAGPGKFCNPTTVYLDAFTWGPTDEVIVLFDQDTHIVSDIIAYKQYLGTMDGAFTGPGGTKVNVHIKPRDRITIGDQELTEYASRAQEAQRPNSWLNHANVTRIYKMIREQYFDSPPLPDDLDCVASKACDLVYTSSNESVEQETVLVFRDSGVSLDITPDGYVNYVDISPVRKAPFETEGLVKFGESGSSTVSFSFQSTSKPGCTIALSSPMSFDTFKTQCIGNADTRTLARANYNVDIQRDAVDVEFNDLTLSFLRHVEGSTRTVLRDGESPAANDAIYGLWFTRSLAAPVDEFRPQDLAAAWGPKLHARLLASVAAGGPTTPETHPLALFTLQAPFFLNDAQPIGELMATVGRSRSWVPEVVSQVAALYHSLPPDEQAVVDPKVLDANFLIETFVDAVLSRFTHGASDRPGTFKAFRTTDDRRWVIGRAHFLQRGVPYRIEVQYSMNYSAVSAVFVEQGWSDFDQILNLAKTAVSPTAPYFTFDMVKNSNNPFGLGGGGVTVNSYDRKLGTLGVTLAKGADSAVFAVPGDPRSDLNGYEREIHGERYEFVPSDHVRLLGKDTSIDVYVEDDGLIGRVEQSLFKGTVELCTGLSIQYGDDVVAKIQGWAEQVSETDFADCDVVFNRSANGNLLSSVASLKNKIQINLVDKRAITAIAWR